MSTAELTASPQDLSNLSLLLQGLVIAGWTPFEVLNNGHWEDAASSQAVLEKIEASATPVIRMIKEGSKTAVMLLEWGQPFTNCVKDATKSYGFDLDVEQAQGQSPKNHGVNAMPEATRSNGQKTDTFQMTNDEGQIYEATRQTGSEWLISFPEGDRRFDGTQGEVKAFIKRLMKEVAQGEAEEQAKAEASDV